MIGASFHLIHSTLACGPFRMRTIRNQRFSTLQPVPRRFEKIFRTVGMTLDIDHPR